MPFATKQLIRPHAIFLVTGILFLVISLLTGGRTLDISIHNTYVIIAYEHIGLAFFLIYGFYTLLYIFIRNYQYRWLSLCHYLFSLPLFLGIFLHPFVMFTADTRRYDPSMQPTFPGQNSLMDDPLTIVVLMFVMAQVLLLIHLILVLVRRFRNQGGKAKS